MYNQLMKKIRILLTAIIIYTLSVPLMSCTGGPIAMTPHSRSGIYFDTVISITLYGDGAVADKRLDEMFKMADRYENLLSDKKSGSDISKINTASGKWVKVHSDTVEAIKQAYSYSKSSGGVFDLTVGTLSSLWDFKNNTGTIPDKAAIEEARKHIDYRNVEIDGNKVRLKDPKARIDLGGIAKGFIADKMKARLEKLGAKNGIINLGGNVLLIGKRPNNESYTVGVQKPFSENGEALFTVKAKNISVVTSGTYQRYFKKNGRIYHHILDIKNGYPYDNGLDSVTIFTKQSTKADALSTTVFAMGLKKGLEFVNKTEGVEAVFVSTDGKITKSDNVDRLYDYEKAQ
ncbi:MAG: FAD:protein FMN transferase [Lachnospiraceae bacterium]|nr:MAG: FAD:protein FMN transferase [Lachnospiraceae bacterium]